MLIFSKGSCFSVEIIHSAAFGRNPYSSLRILYHPSGKRRGQFSLLRFIRIIICIYLIVGIKQIYPAIIRTDPESTLPVFHHTDNRRITQTIRLIIFTVMSESTGCSIQLIQTFKSSNPIITQIIFHNTADITAG